MRDEEFLLPKTIRQIGDIQGRLKICLEDYVMTYIRKKEQRAGENYLGILLGERRKTEQADYVLIRGILEVAEADCQGEGAGEDEKGEEWNAREDGEERNARKEWKVREKREDQRIREERKDQKDGKERNDRGEWKVREERKDRKERKEREEPGERREWEKQESRKEQKDRKERKEWKEWEEKEKPDGREGNAAEKEASGWERADTEGTQEKLPARSIWEKLHSDREMYFPGWEVQGCCVIGACRPERMEQLAEHVPDAGRLLYHLQDREERLYQMEEGRYQGIRGYFVFYEQNRRMQEYLEDVFREERVEEEAVPEQAVKSFREKIRNMSEEKSRSFLKLAASFFVITVLVIGAAVVNRLDDIHTAETPAEAEGEAISVGGSAEESGVLTQASREENSQQQSEEVLPGSDHFWEDSESQDGSANADAAEVVADAANAGEADAGEASATEATGAGSQTTGTGAGEASGAATAAGTDETAASEASASAARAGSQTTGTGAGETSGATNAAEEATAAETDKTYASEASAAGNEEGVSGASSDSQADVQEASSRQLQAAYVIREGDTLADICKRYYGSLERLEEICEVNEIEDADRILPGQKIVLP